MQAVTSVLRAFRNRASVKMSGKGPEFPNVVHMVKSLASSSGNFMTLVTTLAVKLPRTTCISDANGNSNSIAFGMPPVVPDDAAAKVLATLHSRKQG